MSRHLPVPGIPGRTYIEMCRGSTRKWNSFIQDKLTMSAMYGDIMPPMLANVELNPIPAFLITVGYSSADQTYMIANAAEIPTFPSIANVTVIGCSS